MDQQQLKQLLENIKNNETSVDEAVKELSKVGYEELEYAKIDTHRNLRNGFPEVIYGEGKTKEHLIGIVKKMSETDNNILITRTTKDVADALSDEGINIEYHPHCNIVIVNKNEVKKSKSKILIIAAGTSDISVADEAYFTAKLLTGNVERLYDVGVAGIHRLLDNQDKIYDADVIICVAGMEGALVSVVGGLVSSPVIAVPTSIGYGANLKGVTTLLAMINSCASGVGVVNIDNGFGGAYLASTIVRTIDKYRD